jgi:hypothetical protein
MTKTNDEKLCDKKTESECLVPIQYYSLENTSKFCAEGSVKNLLYMLRLSEYDVTVYWDLATAPLHSISERLHDVVPKIVCNLQPSQFDTEVFVDTFETVQIHVNQKK